MGLRDRVRGLAQDELPLPNALWLQVSKGPLEFRRYVPVGEDNGEGKGSGKLLDGKACFRPFVLRVFTGWGFRGGLGEDLNGIFISFMLMCQREIYPLNIICLWVWLANEPNLISTISPSTVI